MCADRQDYPKTHKLEDSPVVIVYPSWIMRYVMASFANLLILMIGIMIGLLLAPKFGLPDLLYQGDC